MIQPVPDEPLPGATGTGGAAPELPPGLVPGLRIEPEPELELLLPAPAPLRLVPVQSGASPLDAATASPRNPITVASQF
jgi:hypothetical protein